MVKFVPDKGDIVWLDFDPQAGREIQKTRPALVISPQAYNDKTSLALFVPITSQMKGYPFECAFKLNQIEGAVLADQVRSLDWKVRQARFIAKMPEDVLSVVIAKIQCLIA